LWHPPKRARAKNRRTVEALGVHLVYPEWVTKDSAQFRKRCRWLSVFS
jgi:hypothetical protein